jgi:hypothetical protein
MTTSSKHAAATAAVLALLALPALAQPHAGGRSTATFGPERTDTPDPQGAPRATGGHGAARADRPGPDQEPGRNAPGRTFAPESSPETRPLAPAGAKPPGPDVPRSPPTGDASGGDRRTALPLTLAQAWREDPDLAGVFAYPHSAGAPLLRRVNDGSEGQPPTPRSRVAHPPTGEAVPGADTGGRAARTARAADDRPTWERSTPRSAASPPPATPSTPPDARASGEGAAAPPLSSAHTSGPE